MAFLSENLGCGELEGAADDLAAFNNADDTGHRDSADADVAHVGKVNRVCIHIADQRGHACSEWDHQSVAYVGDHRHDQKP